jgi:hypothetical protein
LIDATHAHPILFERPIVQAPKSGDPGSPPHGSSDGIDFVGNSKISSFSAKSIPDALRW